MAAVIGRGVEHGIADRRAYWIYAFGRLTPGATMEQAGAQVNGLYQPIIRDVEAPLQLNMRDSVMKRFLAKRVVIEAGARGQSSLGSEAGSVLFMLFAITGLVLLIACANIANLLMARATSRELEMAIRLSLGATRRQLLAQLLTETITLAVIGGVLSLAFASWTLQGIAALLPHQITDELALGLNWAAVGFAAVLSLLTGFAFGLFPALHSTRPDLVTSLRNNSGKLAGGRTARRFRTTLATAQIALAMALLMSAGLFLKSLWKVERAELGVRVENLVTFTVTPAQSGYDSVRARALYARIEEELASLPGALAVTSTVVPLIAGSNWGTGVRVQGFRPNGSESHTSASFNGVGAGHFRAIGVPLLAGREFTRADDAGAPKVAIVNQTFARRFGLGANPVGKRMATSSSDTLPLDIEIVGLVKDTKYSSVKEEIPPVYFTPHRQMSNVSAMFFYVRTTSDPSSMLRSTRLVVQRIDPMLPVENLRTMPEEIRINTFADRIITTLAGSFARSLRSPRILHRATHSRDRCADGVRCHRQRGPTAGAAPGGNDDTHRRPHWPRWCGRVRQGSAVDVVPDGWRRSARHGDVGRVPRTRRAGGRLRASTQGVAGGSDAGVALRIAGQPCSWWSKVQETPNRSRNMPKRDAKNVVSSAM
jgi:predicted permease